MNKIKWHKSQVLILIMVLILPMLSGCTSHTERRYALCMSHMSNSFTNILVNAARTRAEELGVNLVVVDAQQSVSRQANQIETLVRDGVTGIIIEPAATIGLEAALKVCDKENIPVVLVTQRIENEQLFDCFVGPDSREGGRLQMENCVKTLNNFGRIVILHGPVGSDAQKLRYQGYLGALVNQPEIRIVAELNADWNAAKAQQIISKWIMAGKQFDAVVAQNDEMALGAIAALEEAGLLEKVKVFGFDASPDALKAVSENKMVTTLSQQTDLQGIKAVEACVGLGNHQHIETEIFIEQIIITSGINQ